MKTKKTINVKDMKGMVMDSPKDILNQMTTFNKLLAEATPEQKVEIQVSQHALAKAFYDMLCDSFNCSDEDIKDVIAGLSADTGLSLSINNTQYTYSNVEVVKAEVNKAFLKSLGYKSQVALCEDYTQKGLPLPSGMTLSTKTIAAFDEDEWDGKDPIATVNKELKQTIEIKNKKSK